MPLSCKPVADCRKRADVNPSLIQTGDPSPDDDASLQAGGGVGLDGGMNSYLAGLRSGSPRPGSGRTRRHISRLQRAGAALIAAACILAAAWYVPGIVAADGRSLSGAVTSNGIVYLNFSGSGQLAAIAVRTGQQVRKGQLLATEAAPATVAVMVADRAALTADQAQLAAALAAGVTATIATARAQLARDQAQLAVDRAQAAAARIVAPSAGTVVAVNGQPGETADAAGIRDYSYQPPGTPITQRPLFSLFPEGPQPSVADGSNAAAQLPVIALRTSTTWQVTVLVPETSVTHVRPGQAVTIDVPAAGIAAAGGRVQEVLATPVVTSQGVAYQAVISVLGRRPDAPPTGMAADVQLGS
jgi:multidrug efflux pump subunit AcrA (membrane-fusion protein)